MKTINPFPLARFFVLAVCTTIALTNSRAYSQFAFTRVADTSTSVPGGSGALNTFFQPTVSGTTVVFHGYRSVSGQAVADDGIYSWSAQSGTLAVVANLTTAIPNSSGNFLNFGYGGGVRADAVVSGSTVVFGGTGANNFGVYSATISGGSVTSVADNTTPFPGGTGSSAYTYSAPSVSGTNVTFNGQHTNQLTTIGIYSASSSGGAITKVVDNNTAIPNDSGNFTDIGFATVSGTNVAFYGNRLGNNQEGIYAGTTTGGALIRIADRNTPIPNGTGNFNSFGTTPSNSGTQIAFKGESPSGFRGIYVGDISGSAPIRIADGNSPIPSGTGNFGDFNPNPVISGTKVAFLGTGNLNQTGIYYEDLTGGTVTKLIARGDALDGRTVSALQFGLGGFDSSSLTFEADYTNGTSGIYYVQFIPVPEPGLILGFSSLILGFVFSRFKITQQEKKCL